MKKTNKTQVWLRQDQVELTLLCLKHAQTRLNTDAASGAHERVSGPFTYRRINEIIVLLGGEEKK